MRCRSEEEGAREFRSEAVPAREILIEQVRLVYRMVSGAPRTMLGVSVFVAAVLHDLGPPIYIWLAAQVALKIGAYVELKWFFPEKMIAARPEHAMYRIMLAETISEPPTSALRTGRVVDSEGGVWSAGLKERDHPRRCIESDCNLGAATRSRR